MKSIKIQASACVIFQTEDILQSNVKIEIYNGNVDSVWAEAKHAWGKIRLNSRCLEGLDIMTALKKHMLWTFSRLRAY